MTGQSSELRVADGQITKLVVSDGDLHISFRNWQEENEDIVFHEVVGIEVFNALNVDLSHVTIESTDPFLTKACSTVEEPVDQYRCFSFYSSWSDYPILRIVAQNFKIRQT